MNTKVCGTCKIEKDVSSFGENRKSSDGLKYSCRDCLNLYQKRRSANLSPEEKEIVLEKSRIRTTKWLDDPTNRARRVEYESTPDRKAYQANYCGRRKVIKAGGEVSLVTTKDVMAIHSMPCTACSAPSPSEADHLVPISKGGGHTLDNLIPLCHSCNKSKGDRLWANWRVAVDKA